MYSELGAAGQNIQKIVLNFASAFDEGKARFFCQLAILLKYANDCNNTDVIRKVQHPWQGKPRPALNWTMEPVSGPVGGNIVTIRTETPA